MDRCTSRLSRNRGPGAVCGAERREAGLTRRALPNDQAARTLTINEGTMYGHGGILQQGRYRRLGSLLPLLLLLGSIALPVTPVAHAQQQAPREPPPFSIRLASPAAGY